MDPSSYYSSDIKVENFNQQSQMGMGSYGGYGAAGGGMPYGAGYNMAGAMGGGYGYGAEGQEAYEEAQITMMAEEIRAEIAQAQGHGLKHAERVLKYELERIETNGEPELVEVDIPKPVKVAKRVLIPNHRYPNEEEQLKSGDPKYAHFGGPLHVRIETEAPIPVAYTRISGLLNELHRLLQPVRDELVVSQMEELNNSENDGTTTKEGSTPPARGRGGSRGGMSRGRGGPMGARGAPRGRGLPRGRGGPAGRGRGAAATQEFVSYPGYYGNYGGAAAATTQGTTEGSYDYSDQGFGGGKIAPAVRGRGQARTSPY